MSHSNRLVRERYDRYIASPEWAAKRREAFEYYGTACAACGDPATDVHHRSYWSMGNEPMEDLRVLCEMCHLTIHNLLKPRGWRSLAAVTDDVIAGRHLSWKSSAVSRPRLSRKPGESKAAYKRRKASPGLPGAIPIPKGEPRDKTPKPKPKTPAEMLEPDEHGFVPRHLRGRKVLNGKITRH